MSSPTMISRRVVLGVALAVAALGLTTGCGGGAASPTSVELGEQGASGQSGTATFTSEGSTTRVVVELSNPPVVPQPSHIHQGTCENPNPQPAFPLNNAEGGAAETTLNASLEELQNGADYYVNVHESEAEIESVVACGDIAPGDAADKRGGGGYGGGGY